MDKANTFAFDANMRQWAFRAFNNLELNRLINDFNGCIRVCHRQPLYCFYFAPVVRLHVYSASCKYYSNVM